MVNWTKIYQVCQKILKKVPNKKTHGIWSHEINLVSWILPGIYGKYKLQCEQVNGRAYFKSGKYGLWWCTNGYWIIGNDNKKGQNFGFVYFKNNVLYPPHKISEWTGRISTNKGWINAGILFDLKGITSSIKFSIWIKHIVLLNSFSEKFYYYACGICYYSFYICIFFQVCIWRSKNHHQ